MTSTTEFKDLSLEELLQKQEEMKAFIAKRLQAKKREALLQIQSIVKEHDLSYDEVVAVIRTTTKRGKAVAIYRNPENIRQTWSGVGDPPAWYVTAKDKEALRIPGA
jgi:DNA-binding protein H-NS